MNDFMYWVAVGTVSLVGCSAVVFPIMIWFMCLSTTAERAREAWNWGIEHRSEIRNIKDELAKLKGTNADPSNASGY